MQCINLETCLQIKVGTVNSEILREFFFAWNVKRHICHVKNLRLLAWLTYTCTCTSLKDKVFSPFRDFFFRGTPHSRSLAKINPRENFRFYSNIKPVVISYVVGTQKNRLNETVLLSTQNICLNWWMYVFTNLHHFVFVCLGLIIVLKQSVCIKLKVLPCQPRMTVTSCSVYKVIRDLASVDHLCINPFFRIGFIHMWSNDSH